MSQLAGDDLPLTTTQWRNYLIQRIGLNQSQWRGWNITTDANAFYEQKTFIIAAISNFLNCEPIELDQHELLYERASTIVGDIRGTNPRLDRLEINWHSLDDNLDIVDSQRVFPPLDENGDEGFEVDFTSPETLNIEIPNNLWTENSRIQVNLLGLENEDGYRNFIFEGRGLGITIEGANLGNEVGVLDGIGGKMIDLEIGESAEIEMKLTNMGGDAATKNAFSVQFSVQQNDD